MKLLPNETIGEFLQRLLPVIDGHIGDISAEYPADQRVINDLYIWAERYKQGQAND